MATPIDKVQNRMSRVRTVALMVFIPTILTFAYWTQNAFLGLIDLIFRLRRRVHLLLTDLITAFTGIVAAVAAWTIMKPGGIFEVELDEPKGGMSLSLNCLAAADGIHRSLGMDQN